MVDLSICIVNTSNIQLLKPCLESIFTHTDGVTFEVIVVDNNSADDSVAVVQRQFPAVELIVSRVTRGYTPNMNMALRAARGRYVALLNDDTLLTSAALGRMIAFLESNPEVGAVGPRLLNGDGSFQVGPRGPATLWTLLCWEFHLDRLFPKSRLFAGFAMTYWDADQPCEMQTASGACIVVRRAVLEQVGMLEERMPLMGPDDLDLSLRIVKAGWRLHYLAGEKVIHYGEVTRRRTQVESMVWMYQGLYWFLAHHFGWGQAYAYRLSVIVGATVRMVVWAVIYLVVPAKRGRAGSRLRGRWRILRLSMSPRFRRTVVAG